MGRPSALRPASLADVRYRERAGGLEGRRRFRSTGLTPGRWTGSAGGKRGKTKALPATAFLSRFLLHILPDGFVRIRHFGLLANRSRAAKLARCRALLAAAPPTAPAVKGDVVSRLSLPKLAPCVMAPSSMPQVCYTT